MFSALSIQQNILQCSVVLKSTGLDYLNKLQVSLYLAAIIPDIYISGPITAVDVKVRLISAMTFTVSIQSSAMQRLF